ncbi:cell death in tomato 1 [Alternaria rosae]|uniref:cell death in tomato 1 n=1 Tax=Alternaria rosae TaxID=1187941 RepID=UPI001E8D269E|nr:cell death in tomato 1 [Alternaria rosae]KAH6870801.1 cell death in tomato 1 [Alternaria rosae]
MQFTQTAFAAILAITSSAAASPLAARQSALQDWQVTRVNIFTPSGRPGSYPWASITADVTDPNVIDLGPAQFDDTNVTAPAGSQGLNCKAQWYTKGENPLDRTWPCDGTSDGYWLMNVLEGSDGFGSRDFTLKFTHVADVKYQGAQYKATYEAEGYFTVGQNLAGSCGGSGVCSFSLKGEAKPFEIAPKKL